MLIFIEIFKYLSEIGNINTIIALAYIYLLAIIFNYQQTFRPFLKCRNYYNVMTILKNVLQAASKRFIIQHVHTMTIKTSLYSNIIGLTFTLT